MEVVSLGRSERNLCASASIACTHSDTSCTGWYVPYCCESCSMRNDSKLAILVALLFIDKTMALPLVCKPCPAAVSRVTVMS